MRLVGLILAITFLCGCNAQRKCERAFKRHSNCFVNDTVIRFDTIKGFQLDTVFIGRSEIDTFYTDSSGVKVITIVKWKDKIIRQILSKTDTIIETKTINKIPIPIITKVYHKWVKPVMVSLSLFLLLMFGLVYLLLTRQTIIHNK